MTQAIDIHRALPAAPDAEEATLGCLMLSPVEVGAILAERRFTAGHFSVPTLGEIYSVIMLLLQTNAPVEPLLICKTLRDRGRLESVGGFIKISELSRCVPTAVNVHVYLDILQENHLLRRVISICTGHASAAYGHGVDVVSLLSNLHADVTALMHRKSTRPTIADVVQEIVEEVRSGVDDSGLLKIGMPGVDGRLQLYRGDLLTISAPTSCGKTALSCQIGLSVAMQGHRIALYPLEMAQKQTLKRAIAQLGGNNADWLRKIVKGADTPHKVAAAQPVLETFIATANTILQMDPHMRDDLHNFEAICADLRAEHVRKPFSFVLVDYLQLIQTSQNFERKQLQIGYITQGFKRLAKELDCVICLPSQVNKEGGTREAQDAENDAAALIKIHGETDSKGDTYPGRVSVWKQREGARHIDLPLTFNGLLTRFEYKP